MKRASTKRVVVDASALVALALNEPAAPVVSARLHGAALFAPHLLAYELGNAAWKKARRDPGQAPAILRALTRVLEPDAGIEWCSVPLPDVVLVAVATGLTVYDASYVWLAAFLGAELVTLDKRVKSAARSTM
jgi:predicted nucleic acid-binding protein